MDSQESVPLLQKRGSDQSKSAFTSRSFFGVFAIVVLCLGVTYVFTQRTSAAHEAAQHERDSGPNPAIRGSVDGYEFQKAWNSRIRGELLQGCGQVCDTTIEGKPGRYFPEVSKHVDCMGLFSNMHLDEPAKAWPPPKTMPTIMVSDYTMAGASKVHDMYLESRYAGGNSATPVWTTGMIDKDLAQGRDGTLKGTYGTETTQRIRKLLMKHADEIKGKHMAVVGSQSPWLESLLLDAGAKHVTTIEYGKIESKDSRISTLTPPEAQALFLKTNGAEPRFDGAATYSSVEHSGLGRYGDSLNPWGDLQSIAKLWCMTAVGGPVFNGVPTANESAVYWNAHRMYDKTRWSHLMANFHQTDKSDEEIFQDADWHHQPMFAFTRAEGL